MKRKDYPSKEELETKFVYDSVLGVLYRKYKKGNKPCLCVNSQGYLVTRIDGNQYLVHVLCYILEHGYRPEVVEHRDLNKLNIKSSNLRPADYSGNNCNVGIRKDNTSGFKGVHKHGSNWRVEIWKDGKRHRKSGFPTPEQANEYITVLRKDLHGDFARSS